MPTDWDGPAYWDVYGSYFLFGADSPQEAAEMLATGDYGLEVGTINGEDYASILPIEELEQYYVTDLDDLLVDPEFPVESGGGGGGGGPAIQF